MSKGTPIHPHMYTYEEQMDAVEESLNCQNYSLIRGFGLNAPVIRETNIDTES